MVYNREGYAPWSLTRKAGVQSATVDGDIEVPQYIQPILDTGFVDEKGDWKGRKSSDEQFFAFGKDEAIPNGGEILAPQATGSVWPLDMTGYNILFIGLKVTNTGNYALNACMGPADFSFANLNPVDAGTTLRGTGQTADRRSIEKLFDDSVEVLTADVWEILVIDGNLANQKLLQFKITNNSGAESDIETAFMRLV
jgi:hypothetical protein